MKDRLLISLFTSGSALIINDIFYLFNLSIFTTFKINISSNYLINLLIIFSILTISLFLLSYLIREKNIKNKDWIDWIIDSFIVFILLMFILLEFKIIPRKIDFSSCLSILFSIILSTCLYFYSFFYLFVVKYKRQ